MMAPERQLTTYARHLYPEFVRHLIREVQGQTRYLSSEQRRKRLRQLLRGPRDASLEHMGGLESLLSKVCNSLDPESIARYGNEGSLETPATRETLLTAIEVWQLAADLSVEEPLGTREVGAVQQWLKTKGMQEEVAETSSIREHSESDKSVLENQITTLKGDLHTVARLRDVKAIRGEEAFVEKIWADKALRHQLLKLWKPMRQGLLIRIRASATKDLGHSPPSLLIRGPTSGSPPDTITNSELRSLELLTIFLEGDK